MSTTVVIMLGILSWVVMPILLFLFVARVNSRRASAVELSVAPPVGKPFLNPSDEMTARFPAEPARFVGRAEAMAAASAALAPGSGRTAVVFHGMAGAGKTTYAVELAYRRQRSFVASAFWSAPTDPDQFGDALRLLAVALDAQWGHYGVATVDEFATLERLENFLPTLTSVLADASLLLVLDNLETLLTPDGQWRDRRWAPLIGALTDHEGPSRVILTSRIAPAGLNPDTVLVQPVHALSRDESLLLVRELPTLRALLGTVAEPGQAGLGTVGPRTVGPGIGAPSLGRCVLTLAQGHPTLLELADAAAAEPPRLAFQLTEVEEAVDGAALAAFLTEGDTRLDAEQLLRTFTAWTITVAATLPAPARLLLQVLCRIEETDREKAILGVNWAALWQRLDQPGTPPPLASLVAPLVAAALIATDRIDTSRRPERARALPDPPRRRRGHPRIDSRAGHCRGRRATRRLVDRRRRWGDRAAASRPGQPIHGAGSPGRGPLPAASTRLERRQLPTRTRPETGQLLPGHLARCHSLAAAHRRGHRRSQRPRRARCRSSEGGSR